MGYEKENIKQTVFAWECENNTPQIGDRVVVNKVPMCWFGVGTLVATYVEFGQTLGHVHFDANDFFVPMEEITLKEKTNG